MLHLLVDSTLLILCNIKPEKYMLFLGFSENNCKFAIGRGIITDSAKP